MKFFRTYPFHNVVNEDLDDLIKSDKPEDRYISASAILYMEIHMPFPKLMYVQAKLTDGNYYRISEYCNHHQYAENAIGKLIAQLTKQ